METETLDAPIRADSDGDLLLRLTADVVCAYLSKNNVPADDIGALIASTHASFQALNEPVRQTPPVRKPAVPIRKSLTDDFIVCLEDGKKYKSLKRHLRVSYGLTPDAYREKWGLPADYPMVAPNYSAKRSDLAKASGLGRNSAQANRPQRRPSSP